MSGEAIVVLMLGLATLGTVIYLVRLFLAPIESARNAELLKKVAQLEAKAKALEGRPEPRAVPAWMK
jgi:hypothetical protein